MNDHERLTEILERAEFRGNFSFSHAKNDIIVNNGHKQVTFKLDKDGNLIDIEVR